MAYDARYFNRERERRISTGSCITYTITHLVRVGSCRLLVKDAERGCKCVSRDYTRRATSFSRGPAGNSNIVRYKIDDVSYYNNVESPRHTQSRDRAPQHMRKQRQAGSCSVFAVPPPLYRRARCAASIRRSGVLHAEVNHGVARHRLSSQPRAQSCYGHQCNRTKKHTCDTGERSPLLLFNFIGHGFHERKVTG